MRATVRLGRVFGLVRPSLERSTEPMRVRPGTAPPLFEVAKARLRDALNIGMVAVEELEE